MAGAGATPPEQAHQAPCNTPTRWECVLGPTPCVRAQVYDLERKGGSIIGGVLKLIQERRANPPAPRDARLPPKPKGQTVGSFREGLQMLPKAMAANMQGVIRWACALGAT